LTLKSTSIAKTGILGTFYPGTSKINGNVTIERYIPAGYRGYRDIAPQTYGPSIYNSWQEGGSATAGYGTFITGRSAVESKSSFQGSPTSANPSPNSSGLDYSINGMPSAFTYNGTGFDTITNTTTTTLDAYKGYRVLIRGDRNFNLFNTPIVGAGSNLLMHDPTILRATGPIVTYNVVYSSSNVQNWYTGTDNSVKLNNNKNGFTMIANPYPCPVLWGDGTSSSGSNTNTVYGASGGSGSHLNASYWYLDPTYGSTGRYKAFNALTGSSAHVYYGSSGDSLYLSLASGGYIQPGEAFFVQTQSSGPSLTFTESTKAPSSSLVSLFGTQTQEKQSKIYVGISNGSITLDEVAIAFGKGYSNVFGAQDAVKIKSESDNIYISDKGQQLSIDGRLPATESDVLPVELEKLSSASNKLQIDATNYIDNGFVPVLKDNYKGTTTALLLGLNAVEFSTDSLVPASYANRFSITFTPSALAINSIIASAILNNKIATITWNTVGEKGESYFEVEKSSDGNNFVSIGKQAAKNTASASYKSTDNDVVATTSYYRIKAVSETGAVNYSNVAKLQLAVNSLQFTVYPNPLVGKTLNVLLSNVNAGKYVVSIYNVLGEKVNEQTISHNGGSATHGLVISNTLSAGMYSVVIREAASNQIVHQTSLTINH